MPTRPTNLVLRQLERLGAPHADASAPDEELLQRFVNGRDEAAFAVLVRRHGAMVFSVCRATLRQRQDAEDVCQATFLVLARHATTIRKRTSLASWLHGVAYRLACKEAGNRRAAVPSACSRSVPSPLDELSGREVCHALHEELQRLPERLRLPLLLCYLQGLTQEEAAHQLGWRASTVKSRVYRGRDLLGRRLRQRGLTLAVPLLAVALTPRELRAAVVEAMARAACLICAGASAAGPVSARVLALARDGAPPTPLLGLKWAATLLAVLAVLAVGLASGSRGDDAAVNEATAAKQLQQAEPLQPPAGGLKDLDGEPLPEGATVRLGSGRWRHGQITTGVAFIQGGKVLVSTGGLGHGICLWDAATGRPLNRIGAGGSCYGLAVSADGKTLLAAGNRLYVLDTATGQIKHQFVNLPPMPYALAPDGKTVASVDSPNGGKCQVYLFEAETGKQLPTLTVDVPPPGSGYDSRAGGFTPDGKCLALALRDTTIRLYDVANGKELRRFEGHQGPVGTVVFAPNGKTLAGGAKGGGVAVWDVDSGKKLRHLELDEPAKYLTISADGKMLAAAGQRGRIQLWDTDTGKALRGWQAHALGAVALAFSPDGKVLASAGNVRGESIRLWDVESGNALQPTEGHNGMVRALSVTADSKSVLSLGQDRRVLGWDLATGQQCKLPFGGLVGPATENVSWLTAELSPGGKALALRGWKSISNSTESVLDTTTGKPLPLPERLDQTSVHAFKFSPDGKLLATVSFRDGIHVWDLQTQKELHHLQTASRDGLPAFSPDGLSLAYAGFNATVHVLDLQTGKEKKSWDLPRLRPPPPSSPMERHAQPSAVKVLAFTPDGRLLAGATRQAVLVWEAATGKELMRAEGLGEVYSVAMSPGGRVVATSGQKTPSAKALDGSSIRLWEAVTGQEIRRFDRPEWFNPADVERAMPLAFASDGRTLISGDGDGTLLVWDLAQRPAGGGALPAEALDECWTYLAGGSTHADRAYWALVDNPKQATELLSERLKPVAVPDPAKVKQWLADLDDPAFKIRDAAWRQLDYHRRQLEPVLRKALQDASVLEVQRRLEKIIGQIPETNADTLRTVRAVTVLEHIGTPQAIAVLEQLADGAPGLRETEAARAALGRLSN
jgi:RNA polymerase sigma factor (sigma-70 family)